MLAVSNYLLSFLGFVSAVGFVCAVPLTVIFLVLALFEKDLKKQNGYLKKAGFVVLTPFALLVATFIGYAFVNTVLHAG